MKPTLQIALMTIVHLMLFAPVQAENDSVISREEEKQILLFMKKLRVGLYIDVYSTVDVKNIDDSSQVLPLYANCMRTNDFRLNVAAILLTYRAEKTRANFTLQLGDIPMLLTKVEYQWIKYMRQANFGFRLTKRTWIDMGYMLNPIGVESSWPVYNKLSTASVGGYFEPGTFVGAKVSTQHNDKFGTAFFIGNPYSLAYNSDTYISAGVQLSYTPLKNLGIYYANMGGMQSREPAREKFQLYNNLIVDYTPVKWLNLQLQYDFAWQTNSHIGPDTSTLSYMNSGFIQASFRPVKWFSCSVKGEAFSDPNGFLSGVYNDEGVLQGLKTLGFTGGVEFKPLDILYLRAEYRNVSTNRPLFYNASLEYQDAVIFTAGLKI
jgi:hypothetical protein